MFDNAVSSTSAGSNYPSLLETLSFTSSADCSWGCAFDSSVNMFQVLTSLQALIHRPVIAKWTNFIR